MEGWKREKREEARWPSEEKDAARRKRERRLTGSRGVLRLGFGGAQ